MSAPLHGLLLAGGHSTRMRRDKAAIEYAGQSQLARAAQLLAPLVNGYFVSVRADQTGDQTRSAHPMIADRLPGLGPLAGIHAALHARPGAAWLVLACDLPFLDAATLRHLIARRAPARLATAYRSSFDQQPEPLCAIWEPHSLPAIEAWIAAGRNCPRALLAQGNCELLALPDSQALDNINTPAEHARAAAALRARGPARTVHVQYFALLRDQAGRRTDTLETQACSARELYEELRALRGLALAPELLRVAINDEFADWDRALATGDRVVFLPPVAGG